MFQPWMREINLPFVIHLILLTLGSRWKNWCEAAVICFYGPDGEFFCVSPGSYKLIRNEGRYFVSGYSDMDLVVYYQHYNGFMKQVNPRVHWTLQYLKCMKLEHDWSPEEKDDSPVWIKELQNLENGLNEELVLIEKELDKYDWDDYLNHEPIRVCSATKNYYWNRSDIILHEGEHHLTKKPRKKFRKNNFYLSA